MADTVDGKQEFLRVELDLWHPECWTTRVTEETAVDIICYSETMDERTSRKRCTLYGESFEQVSQAIETTRESPLVEVVKTFEYRPPRGLPPALVHGRVSRDIVVEYDTDGYVGPMLREKGFLLEHPSRMESGREIWPLIVEAERDDIGRKLEAICGESDVDVTLTRLSPIDSTPRSSSIDDRVSTLSPRQREALELARRRGYYNWPREITVRELAADFGVSKSTYLEHLRLAEATILNS